MNDVATFEFCVRGLPARRNYLMAAGLVLDYLCGLGFLDSQLAELDNTILPIKSTTQRPRRARP
jgi:nicotinate phosphoribosyltransferase